jgi:hypothetical protein
MDATSKGWCAWLDRFAEINHDTPNRGVTTPGGPTAGQHVLFNVAGQVGPSGANVLETDSAGSLAGSDAGGLCQIRLRSLN